MSDTPRTDAAVWHRSTNMCPTDFARQLERELAAASSYAMELRKFAHRLLVVHERRDDATANAILDSLKAPGCNPATPRELAAAVPLTVDVQDGWGCKRLDAICTQPDKCKPLARCCAGEPR